MTLFVTLRSNNAGLNHFPVQVVTFPRPLTHAGKYGITTVAFGNVIDELHDDDRLAYAGAAERTDLTALGEGADQINNLDASFKNLRRRILIGERWSRAVDRIPLGGLRSRLVIDRIASDVKNTSENFFANGHGDRSPRISDREAALQTFRRGHGN